MNCRARFVSANPSAPASCSFARVWPIPSQFLSRRDPDPDHDQIGFEVAEVHASSRNSKRSRFLGIRSLLSRGTEDTKHKHRPFEALSPPAVVPQETRSLEPMGCFGGVFAWRKEPSMAGALCNLGLSAPEKHSPPLPLDLWEGSQGPGRRDLGSEALDWSSSRRRLEIG